MEIVDLINKRNTVENSPKKRLVLLLKDILRKYSWLSNECLFNGSFI